MSDRRIFPDGVPKLSVERPMETLHRAAKTLDAALCVSAYECIDGRTRLKLLALVKPAPTALRWHSRRERLAHGTTLASCDLQTRPVLDDAAGVLLDVLGPLLAEHQRRHAA